VATGTPDRLPQDAVPSQVCGLPAQHQPGCWWVTGTSCPVGLLSYVDGWGRRLRVTATSIEITDGSTVDDQVASSLEELFSFTYRLRDLPEGVVIRSIDPVADGFVVGLAGADVSVAVD